MKPDCTPAHEVYQHMNDCLPNTGINILLIVAIGILLIGIGAGIHEFLKIHRA